MRTKSILIVDDERINHMLCEKVLASFAWIDQVLNSYNGREALELVRDCCIRAAPLPDIILLDLHMPLMNGVEFLHEFKQLECSPSIDRTVIAVLSSSVNPQEINQVKAMGVKHVIGKPLCREKFLEVIVKEKV